MMLYGCCSGLSQWFNILLKPWVSECLPFSCPSPHDFKMATGAPTVTPSYYIGSKKEGECFFQTHFSLSPLSFNQGRNLFPKGSCRHPLSTGQESYSCLTGGLRVLVYRGSEFHWQERKAFMQAIIRKTTAGHYALVFPEHTVSCLRTSHHIEIIGQLLPLKCKFVCYSYSSLCFCFPAQCLAQIQLQNCGTHTK